MELCHYCDEPARWRGTVCPEKWYGPGQPLSVGLCDEHKDTPKRQLERGVVGAELAVPLTRPD